MSGAIFPLVFASEEARLLTAIAIGLVFGFSLERAGFGNARKLAAQFYLHDMTVFKVMFTAVLVAMVGLYTLAGVGLLDFSRLYVNPTFVWGQAVGGLLIGAGFMMSGLCPGTSAVSAASGRLDGLVTLAGIFVGTLVFAVAVDWFPAIDRLYQGGALDVSLLPALLHLPAPLFVLLVVGMAAGAFVGAEKLERAFRARYAPVECAPRETARTPQVKFALTGALAAVALVSLAWKAPPASPAPRLMQPVAPLALARAMIGRAANLVILDLRPAADRAAGIPGAVRIDPASPPAAVGPGTTVVLYDETGAWTTVPLNWPAGPAYRYLAGGLAAWRAEVLTPAPAAGATPEDRERIARQHAIAAFFSGAAIAAPAVSGPPPALPAGPAVRKKRVGGC